MPRAFHAVFAGDGVTLTLTTEELGRMAGLGLSVWGTPNPEGIAQQAYVASRPQWREDFILATIEDCYAELGIDTLGWDELSEEERATCALDLLEITVPRAREPRRF